MLSQTISKSHNNIHCCFPVQRSGNHLCSPVSISDVGVIRCKGLDYALLRRWYFCTFVPRISLISLIQPPYQLIFCIYAYQYCWLLIQFKKGNHVEVLKQFLDLLCLWQSLYFVSAPICLIALIQPPCQLASLARTVNHTSVEDRAGLPDTTSRNF